MHDLSSLWGLNLLVCLVCLNLNLLVWEWFLETGLISVAPSVEPFVYSQDHLRSVTVLVFRWPSLSLQISLIFRSIGYQDLGCCFFYSIYIYIHVERDIVMLISRNPAQSHVLHCMLREVSHEGNFKQHLWGCCIRMPRPSERHNENRRFSDQLEWENKKHCEMTFDKDFRFRNCKIFNSLSTFEKEMLSTSVKA